MKNLIKIPFILLLVISLYMPLKASDHPEVHFTEGTFEQVLKKAKDEKKVLMIDFVTDWCKWCIETDKKVYTNPDVASFANENQVNWKIDAEKGEGIELAKKYNVKGYPTIVFVNGKGEEIDRIYGYIFADAFLERMKDYKMGVNTYTGLKKGVEKKPNDAASNFKFAQKMIDNGESEGAVVYLEKVVTLDPGNSAGFTDDAKYSLASIKNDAAALKAFMQEYPESNKLKDSYISLAGALAETDYAGAYNIYKDAFAKYGSTDRDLHFNYGMFLYSYGYQMWKKENGTETDKQAGLKALEESLEYVKGSVNEPSAYYITSGIYYDLKDYAKATENIDKALALADKKAYRELQAKITSGMTEVK